MEVSNALISKHIGGLIKYLTVTVSSENHKELAKLLATQIKNGRSLVGEDLLDLFKMIDKFSLLDMTKPLVMTVASNLQTIDKETIRIATEENGNFARESDRREEANNENKRMIFNKYKSIYQSDPELVHNENGMGSLSQLIAGILPDFTD